MLISMIHRLIVYNQKSHEGLIVFDRNSIDINSSLLVSLIESMLLLSKELGKVEKGHLKEIELGKYQISLLDHKSLTYIVIQGTYDNELFTRRIINLVIEKYHSRFVELPFKAGLNVESIYQDELGDFIQTLNFPDEIIPQIESIIGDLLIRLNNRIDLLFITDLDNGITKVFTKPKKNSKQLINLLMQILSEIPLEKAWIGESRMVDCKKENGEYESWIITRIGLTEFCIIARGFYYSHDRDKIIIGIEEIADLTHEMYINWSLTQ